MIRPSELQIGNWFSARTHEEMVVTIAMRMEGSETFYLVNGRRYDQIDPIPITPEWLLQFEFTVSAEHTNAFASTFMRGLYEVVIWHEPRVRGGVEYRPGDITCGMDTEWPPTVKYVHELQNTYYWQTRTLLMRNVKL